MRTFILFACCISITFSADAQYDLKGKVLDTLANAIPYTTVSLLKPEDSTLAHFGITNNDGNFEVKDIAKGNYLMQVAFMGFKTYYKKIDIPYTSEQFGTIILTRTTKQLDEVAITTERVPISIKKDTIEYNAGAFKTKPDASVEELLKKLPGMEVDHAGNIKAQGENVRKVLVDGKEFFGDDPKVATKNLPSDAISKVQVFNKKSDASEFTGIDDGFREKTINLMLKEGKKVGYFGDVQAGVGTDDKYKLNGKLYQFKKTTQFAALGMFNNINQFGFSFQDYINFNGGIQSLMNGGETQRSFDGNDLPVDFGQPILGKIRSGAGGLNYSYEPKKNHRIAVSYLGNGADKMLSQNSYTRNFTNNEPFTTNSNTNQTTDNIAHRLNLSIRQDMDSTHQFTLNGNGAISNSTENSIKHTNSLIRDMLLNKLDGNIYESGNKITAGGNASYLKHTTGAWPVLRLSGNVSYNKELTKTDWQNITSIMSTGNTINDNQFRNDDAKDLQYSATANATRSLNNSFYFEPRITAGNNVQSIHRRQSLLPNEAAVIDSLSPQFLRQYQYIRPGFSLRKSTLKTQYSISLNAEAGMLSSTLNSKTLRNSNYTYILPAANWQYEYNTGKRLSANYSSTVRAPEAERMLPVFNSTNPLMVYTGNNNLKPEYVHNIMANWIWFDQFTFSSAFANIGGAYTKDKITLARTINNDLTQSVTPINTAYDYNLNGRIEYSRPVRKLGVNVSTSLNERMEKGINFVNNIENKTTTFSHELSLTINNRKKEKWDIQVGGTINLTDAQYSVYSSLNNRFNNITAFSELSFRPNDHWFFMMNADITQYNAQSFDKAISIPLLKAEISYYFMKGNRSVLILDGFDLLNKNTGIQRNSQLNMLRETTSNVMGRYFMLSYKYRLNKTGKGPGGGMNIKISNR